ncbi:MAG: 30S ribosomal protein S4 [Anaerolineae bacterium]|jgi:small subunit ribosomal protein S4
MGRYRGPHNKLSRREGVDLFGTGGQSLQRRIGQIPGDHGRAFRRGRPSDFALQLREKQKVKRIYGMRERQFRRFFDMARRESEMTGSALLKLLERRLDSAIYRGGFARSRPMARQLITHGHIYVDGQRVTVPSFLVEPGMAITLSKTAHKMPDIQWSLEAPATMCPPWLGRDDDEIRVVDMPSREDVDQVIEDNLVVEFYSR